MFSKILCRKSLPVTKVVKYDMILLIVQKAVTGSRQKLLGLMITGRSFVASVTQKLAGKSVEYMHLC